MGAILAMPYTTLTVPVTTTGGALWLGPDGITAWSMTVVVTGTLTGVFRFYASDDPRARPDRSAVDRAAAVWVEFTSDVSSMITNPGNTVTFKVMVSNFASDFLRMDYVHTSGTATIASYFSGRSE